MILGRDLYQELKNLEEDLHDDRFQYDVEKAMLRINFIENCCRLTKSPFFNKPMKLMLWQKALIEATYSFKMLSIDTKEWVDRFTEILLLIARKNGKALALDIKIPTPDGWKQMKDIHVGDYVFSKTGKPSKVLAESEIFNKPMYRVEFEDGSIIDASEDHIWTVQTKTSRRIASRIPEKRRRTKPDKYKNHGWFDITTKEMKDDFALSRKDGKGTEFKYRVPMNSPIEYSEKKLPLDPYTFGVWLGDGCKNHTGITCSDADRNEVMNLLNKEGHRTSWKKPSIERAGTIWIDSTGRTGKKFDENKTLKALKEIGVFKNKHIPEMYLQASVNQRLALLQGLMDTDGTCSKAGQCEFTQKSKELSLQVLELIRSLGIKACLKEKNATCNGKDCGIVYRITFFTSKDFPCFRLKRKYERLKDELAPRMRAKSIINITKIETRESKCIAIDDVSHLYLASDGFTCTHNTETIAALEFAEFILGKAGSDIVCSGMDDGTSDLSYQTVDTMRLLIDPKSKDTWRNQKGLKNLINDSHIYKLSDSSRQKEGRNIDFAGIDEVWSLTDSGIYEPIRRSTSTKEDYKIFMFGSEGYVDDGFLDQKRKEYTKIIYKEDDKDSSLRKLPWLYTLDSEMEIWETNEDGISRAWEKANPGLGTIKLYSYLKDQVDEARESTSARIETSCKDFNIKQKSVATWLKENDFNYECKFDLRDFEGCYYVGGVDLAETSDLCSTKIIMMKPDDNRKYIYQHYFIPEIKLEKENDDHNAGAKYKEWVKDGYITIAGDTEVDISIIADWFYSLYKDFKLKLYKVGYDQKFALDWLKSMEDPYGWTRKGEDADLILIMQNAQTLSAANSLCESEFKRHLIYYNNNPVDAWCLSNAGLKIDKNGSLIVKREKERRIDGAVTYSIAFETLRRYRSDFNKLIKIGGKDSESV